MALSGFSAFDTSANGFCDGRVYLVHGPVGAGKTTFALQFLLQGLRSGERVALVVRRSAPVVLDQARAFGFDLDRFVASGALVLLEYAPHVVENCARLKNDEEIFEEFCSVLSARVKRVVLDPVTPLLASASSATLTFRARSLMNSFGQLGATALYLCDSPEADAAVTGLRDVVYGTLRLEPCAAPGRGRLLAEQLPGVRFDALEYRLEPGIGLAAAEPQRASGSERAPAARRSVLVVAPRAEDRERAVDALSGEYEVAAASDAADGLARMAAAAPDLVVIDQHAGSLEGAAFCRKLRASRLNIPIILMADRLRRTRDRIALLESGADECLERPVDPRLLRLKTRALLARYDPGTSRLRDASPAGGGVVDERDGIIFTTDFSYFMSRVHAECEAAREQGISFGVVALQPPTPESFPFLCQRLQGVVREYDLVCARDATAFVLLAETEEKGVFAFLDRLERASQPDTAPASSHLWQPPAEASITEVDAFVERNMNPRPLPLARAAGE